ncbi:RHS repeat domain-containing protein, partial [Pseudomonas sp. CAM1A]|uniref:RHS repeat domain-containing protein n=1 Tax=Pseudomonas sp. CAM1A TaxID=3231717 RepID=UPI0039C67531
GLDYLFSSVGTYAYGSTETRTKQGEEHKVEREYNRFHLLVREETTHTDTQAKVTSTEMTETAYYSNGGYFHEDHAYCQLPGITTRTWKRNTGMPYLEGEIRQYKPDGNLEREAQVHGDPRIDKPVLGLTTAYQWHPTGGEGADPRDPNFFTPRLKRTARIPDPTAAHKDAPTLYQHYSYEKAAALPGAGPKSWHRIKREVLSLSENESGDGLQATDYAYFDTPSQYQTHGRVKAETVTLNGKPTVTAYCYDCEEEAGQHVTAPVDLPAHVKALQGRIKPLQRKLLNNEPVLTTFQTVEGWDHKEGAEDEASRQKTITLTHSLLTGEPVLNADDNDVQIQYKYDQLRRVTAETVAPDDDAFKATRHYTYTLCSKPGDQAQQTRQDVNEVITRTTLDGLNRVVKEERQDTDFDAGNYCLLYTAVYNTLGQLTEQTEYDWHEKTLVPLNSTFEYDIWGQQRAVTGPDKVKVIEENDPVGTPESKGKRVLSWREEGSEANPKKTGITEIWLNRFNEQVWIERRDLRDGRVSLQVNGFDGLGRLVEQVVGDTVKRITGFTYDAFNRNVKTVLPGGAIVLRTYAEHSGEDLPITIAVQESAVAESKELGTQDFDGLGRMAVSTTGGREQTYAYDAGVRKPKTVKTPEGEIHYTYELKLSENPETRLMGAGTTAGELEVIYDYDKKNARLKGWTMPAEGERPWQRLKREYYQTGQIKSETWTQHESGDEQAPPIGEPQTQHYVYSHRGRLLKYTDVLGQVQTNDYYPTGQLQKTTLKDKAGKVLLETDFTYYELGQLKSYTTHDREAGQSLATELQYDEFDRESERKFTAGSMVQTLTQLYDDVDALTTRTLSEGGVNLRVETYAYDKRQRLETYTFSGRGVDNDPYQPQDPYGNYITEQVFDFDALDNITEVVTTFVGGSNTATYHFEGDDPAQLSRITNKATDPTVRTLNGYPAEIVLAYDDNGNLTNDEQGRVLKYNALNQLLSVSEEEQQIVSYFYNPQNILMGTDEEQRFYLGDELTALKTGDGGTRISTSPAGPLAETTVSQGQE